MRNKIIVVNNLMQKNYKYILNASTGKNFNKEFNPDLTPKEMIDLGVFGGKYETVNNKEFPNIWFLKNKLTNKLKNPDKNFFKVNASQSLPVWKEKGWIYFEDPQGWFLWYCRYYMGRRLPDEDNRQIKRWSNMKRHVAQLKKNCKKGDINCRVVQRQALLHWAYDSRRI